MKSHVSGKRHQQNINLVDTVTPSERIQTGETPNYTKPPYQGNFVEICHESYLLLNELISILARRNGDRRVDYEDNYEANWDRNQSSGYGVQRNEGKIETFYRN